MLEPLPTLRDKPWHPADVEPLSWASQEINAVRHKPLLDAIECALDLPPEQAEPRWPTPYFLEAGCGSASLSIALCKRGRRGLAVELNPTVADYAYGNRMAHGAFGMTISSLDMARWPRLSPLMYGVCFSEGVLDHIADDKLVDYITATFFNAPEVMHVVTTAFGPRCCDRVAATSKDAWLAKLQRIGLSPGTATEYGSHLLLHWSL